MLLLIEPPTIDSTTTRFEVNISDTVTFWCEATAYPSITDLVWEKVTDGVTTQINKTQMPSNLTLSNIGREDSGTYRCKVTNAAGTTSLEFILDVISGNDVILLFTPYRICTIGQEEFEDAKRVMRICILKKNRTQCQWPKEKVQKDKQRSTKHTHKSKDRITRTPLKQGVNSGAPERLAVPTPLVAPVVLI